VGVSEGCCAKKRSQQKMTTTFNKQSFSRRLPHKHSFVIRDNITSYDLGGYYLQHYQFFIGRNEVAKTSTFTTKTNATTRRNETQNN
jgi:hypothetical protein